MTELQLTIRLNFIPWRFRSCPASALSSSYLPHSTQPTSWLDLSFRTRTADFTLAFNTAQMPWQTSHAVADMPDDERQKILARIRRMPPTDACAALLNLRPYLEKPGHVYVHVRLNWDILQNAPTIADDDDLDYLDIKVGKAIDMDARRAGYAKCDGEEIIWCFYYKTDHPKLIGLRSSPSRTFLGEVRGAGVRGVGFRKIGELPVRHPMYDE
ncbi:hypothetical protein K438DRAFT_1786692 [Mycena galopus ATCC 62051]|nr:hypothetical protein K438DRAFT_1786692 [Mycena galopus ATCC 62051]